MYPMSRGTHLLLREEFASLIIDLLVEISTITVVHDDVEAAPILEGILVGHDVGVLHLGQDLHLDSHDVIHAYYDNYVNNIIVV